MSLKESQKKAVNDEILKEVFELLNNLKYGNVQITVHNSRVVQIDKTEKTRFDEIRKLENGSAI